MDRRGWSFRGGRKPGGLCAPGSKGRDRVYSDGLPVPGNHHLFIPGRLCTADGFTGEPRECDEGALEWVEINKVEELDLWEGDKIFFRLLRENRPFFSLKLSYDDNGILLDAVLDGEPIATKEGRKMPEAESGTMN
mgnify:CR=1 FL=1